MKKLKIFPLILVFCLVFSAAAPAARALDDPGMAAKYVVLADLQDGRILFERNMNIRTSPASLTKIMTILLAVEAVENGEVTMEEMVAAQSDCRVGMDEMSSTAGIVPGEELSFKDLMYCAMLLSANEACNIIATRLSGSISAFVNKMNEKAALLGCTDTHFANTNGLTDSNHYTTAYDFYLIAREAIKHPIFMEICNTISYNVPATPYCDMREMSNSNALISAESVYNEGHNYLYEGTSGVKTGYTNAAGYCLISTCMRDGVNVIAVIMGCDGPLNSNSSEYGNFVESRKIYDWAFGNFSYRDLVTTEPVAELPVELAQEGATVSVQPKEGLRLLLPNETADTDIQITTSFYEETLTAPVDAGTELGEMEVIVRGESYGRIKLVSMNSVEMSKSEYMRQRLGKTFGSGWFKAIVIILVAIVLIYAILVIRYRRARRRHMRERRMAEQRRRMERERRAVSRPEEYSRQRYDGSDRRY